MASLTCVWTAFIWECVRAPPDDACLKGYNVYESDIQLQGSSLPVWVAHQTRARKYPPGTLARIFGHSNTYEQSLLVVASVLIPVTLAPLPGPQPSYAHLLPRFTYSGVVASHPLSHVLNNGCFCFLVAIKRADVFPVQEIYICSWVNREADRLQLNRKPALNDRVTISGVFCGWSKRDSIMVDVHTIENNYSGPVTPQFIAHTPNPFEGASFVEGCPEFPAFGPTEVFADIFSRHAPLTRVTRQYPTRADPRLQHRAEGHAVVTPARLPRADHIRAPSPAEEAPAVAAAQNVCVSEAVARPKIPPIRIPAFGRVVARVPPEEAMQVDTEETAIDEVDEEVPPQTHGMNARSAELSSLVSGWMPGDEASAAHVEGDAQVGRGNAIAHDARDETAAAALLQLGGSAREKPEQTDTPPLDVPTVTATVQDVRDAYDRAVARSGRAGRSNAARKRAKIDRAVPAVATVA